MDKKLIYIACPYTLGDVAVNVHNAIETANQLADAGFIPYVPIWTHFWHLVTPRPYEFWTEMDLEFVKKCDAILRIPGESKGADNEIKFANSLNIPVYYSIQELLSGK
jgi:hypothetical protein